eukprot:518603-Prymnesium_polylepis.1
MITRGSFGAKQLNVVTATEAPQAQPSTEAPPAPRVDVETLQVDVETPQVDVAEDQPSPKVEGAAGIAVVAGMPDLPGGVAETAFAPGFLAEEETQLKSARDAIFRARERSSTTASDAPGSGMHV